MSECCTRHGDAIRDLLEVIDSVGNCHGCLDNSAPEDRETVERVRRELVDDAPAEVPA